MPIGTKEFELELFLVHHKVTTIAGPNGQLFKFLLNLTVYSDTVGNNFCRHLEIFELVRLEDERELSSRLEAVSRLDFMSVLKQA